jgi:hypothetical protein
MEFREPKNATVTPCALPPETVPTNPKEGNLMSAPDIGQNQHHSADRREILRRIGASSAIVTLGPLLPINVLAQNKASDLPPSIEEAGKRLRDRSLSVTELTHSYLKHERFD